MILGANFIHDVYNHFFHELAALPALHWGANLLIYIFNASCTLTDGIGYLAIGNSSTNTYIHQFIPERIYGIIVTLNENDCQ